jgi:outer membrane protein assembly factor BamA
MLSIIFLIPLLSILPGKTIQPTKTPVTQERNAAPFKCLQPAAEQDALIREAVENQYWVRRVEFVGSEHTRDSVLRARVVLQEGDIFTRDNLLKSLVGLSQLNKIIYPVKLNDVILRLDKPEKIVDVTICFEEKPKTRRAAKPGYGKRAR